jgi:hypothetical protein
MDRLFCLNLMPGWRDLGFPTSARERVEFSWPRLLLIKSIDLLNDLSVFRYTLYLVSKVDISFNYS